MHVKFGEYINFLCEVTNSSKKPDLKDPPAAAVQEYTIKV